MVPADLASAGAGDHPSGAVRSVPDISADADPFTPFNTGLLSFPKNKPPVFSQEGFGGTSVSVPPIAGMVIAAQQGQPRSFGFINPALYRLAGTSAVRDVLALTSSSPARWRAAQAGDIGVHPRRITERQSPPSRR